MADVKKTPQKKSDDTVIYKAMVDIAVFLAGFFLLRWVGDRYGYVETLDIWTENLRLVAIVCAPIFAVTFVMSFVMKRGKKWWVIGAVASGVIGLSCLALHLFWQTPMPYLYFLLIAGCALYLIWILYPADFFTISLVTTLCGAAFYLHGQQAETGTFSLVRYAICIVLLAVALLLGKKATANGGKLLCKGKGLRFYDGKAGAKPVFITCAVWTACIAASLIVGPVFAYYCVYVAAGYLFIAACYYTIRLG